MCRRSCVKTESGIVDSRTSKIPWTTPFHKIMEESVEVVKTVLAFSSAVCSWIHGQRNPRSLPSGAVERAPLPCLMACVFMVICVNGVFSQRGRVGTSANSTQANRTWASAASAKVDSRQFFDLGEQKFHANIRWVLVVFVCSFFGGSAPKWALRF